MKSRVLPYFIVFTVTTLFGLTIILEPQKDIMGTDWIENSKLRRVVFEDENGQILIDLNRTWLTVEANSDSPSSIKIKPNQRALEILTQMQGFPIVRLLGSAENFDLSKFGLARKELATVTIYTQQDEYKFSIGSRSFQSSNTYLLDHQKQQLLLASRRWIDALRQPASTLMEEGVWPREAMHKVVNVELEYKARTKSYQSLQDGEKQLWAVRGEEFPHRKMSAWMERVLSMTALAYTSEEKSQNLGAEKALLGLRLLDKNMEIIDSLILVREASSNQFFAQTSYTKSFVAIDSDLAQELLQDLIDD